MQHIGLVQCAQATRHIGNNTEARADCEAVGAARHVQTAILHQRQNEPHGVVRARRQQHVARKHAHVTRLALGAKLEHERQLGMSVNSEHRCHQYCSDVLQ